jgi:23S rRNA (cytidine1920-2'-O)/16S rRNA (cytidine1409-2'-O)-methyltransferase
MALYGLMTPTVKRERIDKLLVAKGLADSRTKAQAMVMAGVVLVDEQRVDKPSDQFLPDAAVRIKDANNLASKYVGRGGLKLEAALREFHIDVHEFTCLDVGASTGGFTDCLLQHGATRVFAVDVGHNQIDWRLRNDPRVEVREGVNARYLAPADFGTTKFDLIVVDVSFISLTKVIPAVVSLMKAEGKLIALIKPQFEVGKGEVGSGGVVKDPEQHERVVKEVTDFAQTLNLRRLALIESPIRGAEGNVEFLGLFASDKP